jgi:hypothetical protein
MSARKFDPSTSKAASANAAQFSGAHSQRIINALHKHGPMSPRALENVIGLSVVQIDRRRRELMRKNQIHVLRRRGHPVIDRGCEVLAVGAA